MACTAEGLPQELWTLILQHVDFTECLSACALVCRKLARAAAAATRLVSVCCYDNPERLAAFLGWTVSHGSSLIKLQLTAGRNNSPIRQLPCANLRELEVDGHVQLCASSEHLGLLHSCTALTKLDMDNTTLLDDGVGTPAGPAPTATARLQSLRLSSCRLAREGTTQALKQRLFPLLTSLTSLDVGGTGNELLSGFPPHISAMASLQQLRLDEPGEA
jgi:hypothetical protein